MQTIQFYKFSLELSSKEYRSTFDFKNKFQDIIDAKDRFNTRLNGSKYIFVSGLTEKAINLILRLDNLSMDKKVDIRAIGSFITILQEDLNWKDYFSANTRKLFNASIIKYLSINECKKVIKDLQIDQSRSFNSTDIKNLFYGLEDEDMESMQYDYDSQKAEYEEGNTDSLESAIDEVKKLTGLRPFKNELDKIMKLVNFNEVIEEKGDVKSFSTFPYHYVFKGRKGMDQLKAARLMTEVFYHLGIIQGRRFVRFNIPLLSSSYSGLSIESNVEEPDTGVVFVEDVFGIKDEDIDISKIYEKLIEKMQQLKGKVVFIISCILDEKEESLFDKLKDAFDGTINYRAIEFPYFEYEELLDLIKCSADAKGFTISADAEDMISLYTNGLFGKKYFNPEISVENVIERAIFEKRLMLAETGCFEAEGIYTLEGSDFKFLSGATGWQSHDENPFNELDEMIGLEEVKKRVRQISNFVAVRMKKKELGIKSKPICLHMEFVGNPGTGKTTVARIIGRIFKRLGFLSGGHFTELTRENLIGPYIGQTAPKVKKAVDESRGGVMFIDEAYSLNQHSDNDFGHEAVSSLVKAMEEYKDDMVVIFAGYPTEMDAMVKMNPGLRDRIAFKVEFEDYNIDELIRIFEKMCRDNGYSISKEVSLEIEKLLSCFCRQKGSSFGNARLVRKIFERVEIIQNTRICGTGSFDADVIGLITEDDAKSLYDDTEISKLLKELAGKGKIGF